MNISLIFKACTAAYLYEISLPCIIDPNLSMSVLWQRKMKQRQKQSIPSWYILQVLCLAQSSQKPLNALPFNPNYLGPNVCVHDLDVAQNVQQLENPTPEEGGYCAQENHL